MERVLRVFLIYTHTNRGNMKKKKKQTHQNVSRTGAMLGARSKKEAKINLREPPSAPVYSAFNIT